jgi:hypothetical protein
MWDYGTGSMCTGYERRPLVLTHDPRDGAGLGTGLSYRLENTDSDKPIPKPDCRQPTRRLRLQ